MRWIWGYVLVVTLVLGAALPVGAIDGQIQGNGVGQSWPSGSPDLFYSYDAPVVPAPGPIVELDEFQA